MTSEENFQTPGSRPIVLLFTGHVGSSWLADLIGRHPQINHVGFEPVDALSSRNVDAHPWIERLALGQDPSHFPPKMSKIFSSEFQENAPYFMFKTRARVRHQHTLFYETIPNLNSFVILLRRRNKLKTAISSYKRNALKISHLDQPEMNAAKRGAIHVDPAEILSLAQNFIDREKRTKSLFAKYKATYGLDGMEIIYEDVLDPAKMDEFKTALCTRLGIAPFTSESKYTKMTENDLRKAVSNFDELADHISGTIFEKFLVNDEYDPVG